MDPSFYKEEFKELLFKMNNSQFKTLAFKELIKSVTNGIEIRNYSKTGYRYLRVSDLSENGIINKNTRIVDVPKIPSKIKLLYSDFLISRSGSLGLVNVVNKEIVDAILSSHIFRVRLDTKLINPLYLEIFFRIKIGQIQFFRFNNGGVIPEINQTSLKRITIILPPLETQQKIITLYQTAYIMKQQKEKEAKELLASIDVYLLNELGITLPEKDNSLKSRIFTVNFSKVSGRRFESEYYTEYNRNLIKVIQESNYPKIKIIDCLSEVKKGIEPGSREYKNEGLPFIRVSDVTKFGIDYVHCDKKISRLFYENHKKEFNPKLNEILFSKDGTLGICLLVHQKEEYIVSSAFLRLITDDFINREYLTYLLSSFIYKELAERNSIGTVIKHLNISKFLNLKIPLPPLEKQNEIANHISDIRIRAKQLQIEAKAGLETAKQEVEEMILG